MILTAPSQPWQIQDDEDMGSPSQDGVNPGEIMPGENRQISGSPSGVPSPVYLSLQKQTLQQHRTSNCADKAAENGVNMSLRGAFAATKQSHHLLEIAMPPTAAHNDNTIASEDPHVWNRRIYRAA